MSAPAAPANVREVPTDPFGFGDFSRTPGPPNGNAAPVDLFGDFASSTAGIPTLPMMGGDAMAGMTGGMTGGMPTGMAAGVGSMPSGMGAGIDDMPAGIGAGMGGMRGGMGGLGGSGGTGGMMGQHSAQQV
jgi:hypothetical protein